MNEYRLGLEGCVHRLLDAAWACSLTKAGHLSIGIIFERHLDFYKLFNSHDYINALAEHRVMLSGSFSHQELLAAWQEKQRGLMQGAIDAWQPPRASLPFLPDLPMPELDFLGVSNRYASATAAASRARLVHNVLHTLSGNFRNSRIDAIDAFEGPMLARLDRAFHHVWRSMLAERVLMGSNLSRDCLKNIAQHVHEMYDVRGSGSKNGSSSA